MVKKPPKDWIFVNYMYVKAIFIINGARILCITKYSYWVKAMKPIKILKLRKNPNSFPQRLINRNSETMLVAPYGNW